MRKRIEEAFKSGILYNMIKKASKDQQGDKTEFQAEPVDSNGKEKDKLRDRKLDIGLDVSDAVGDAMAFRGGRP